MHRPEFDRSAPGAEVGTARLPKCSGSDGWFPVLMASSVLRAGSVNSWRFARVGRVEPPCETRRLAGPPVDVGSHKRARRQPTSKRTRELNCPGVEGSMFLFQAATFVSSCTAAAGWVEPTCETRHFTGGAATASVIYSQSRAHEGNSGNVSRPQFALYRPRVAHEAKLEWG